jgi:hypothetical protein
MNVSSPAMKFAGQAMNAGQAQAAKHAAPQFGAQTQAAAMNKPMNAAPAPTFGKALNSNPKFGQKFNAIG